MELQNLPEPQPIMFRLFFLASLELFRRGKSKDWGATKPCTSMCGLLPPPTGILKDNVNQGKFREDLFYRLNVMNLHIPPLREREDDISLLAMHFLKKYALKNRKGLRGFTSIAMDVLAKSGWPGNVRELKNVIERAVILTHERLHLRYRSASVLDGNLPHRL